MHQQGSSGRCGREFSSRCQPKPATRREGMDRAVVSALAAILGSLVGGAATIATAWLTQRTQGRRASIDAEVRKREALYIEFITEGSKVLVEGFRQTAEDLRGF